MFLLIYALLLLFSWMLVSVYLVIMSRKIISLKTVQAAPLDYSPAVAIVIAVKDEEAEVEAALQSVCNLLYPNFRVIVINDRSTDQTPIILERMASRNGVITLLNVKTLPEGWLGKNHALYKGYISSQEEWLLFTDADVLFSPLALDKAMHYAQQKNLDHLTVLPEITSKSVLFKSVVTTFALMLNVKLRPWNASDPHSKASIGVGAFNLVKRTAYQKAGTHQAIALRPDDDLKLAQRLKEAGCLPDVVYGEGEISLQWYSSLGEFFKGLMKNTFSVADYNIWLAVGMALSTFLVIALPLPLLLLSEFPYYWMGIVIFIFQLMVMLFAGGIQGKWWHTLVIPFAGGVMTLVILISAIRTLYQGGIYWRGSFYPLETLRKQV